MVQPGAGVLMWVRAMFSTSEGPSLKTTFSVWTSTFSLTGICTPGA